MNCAVRQTRPSLNATSRAGEFPKPSTTRRSHMSKLEMLTPQNCAIALIDYQPAMYQGVQSHDRLVTFNNVQVLAKAAKLFKVPTVLSTIAATSFSGPYMPEVTGL